MRDFLWQYFQNSGDIEAYLLLREHERLVEKKAEPPGSAETAELEAYSS
jgi:hypothetical protein